MSKKYKVVYYLNQFFGQIGGEDKAGIEPFTEAKAIGPAQGFEGALAEAEVAGTVVCGDNYFNENKEALPTILEMVSEYDPDLLVAGPAFNAGRYGMACAEVCKAVKKELGIPTITAMYPENPGVEVAKKYAYIIKTVDSAAGMRKALPDMANIAAKLLKGEEIGRPADENYIPQGRRKTVFSDKRGSLRAVEMLIARLKGEDYKTELPMPEFDEVEAAAAVKDLTKANIALVSTGGIVPKDNPDHLESASATKFGEYSFAGVDDLKEDTEFFTIHGGYDPVYANEDPNRVVPLDVLRDFEKDGTIGKLHDKYYVTTGTGTAVANGEKFGKEIGKKLQADGVDAVILTST